MFDITGHDSRSETVFIVTTTTFILATIFVAARLISRFVILKNRTADDWLILASWSIAFGLSFSIDWSTSKGLGRHDADIQDSWRLGLEQTEYAFTILYNPALMATKTSILLFYLRLARNTQKLLRIASYATLVIVIVAGIVLTFINAFQCTPVKDAFTPGSPGTCISTVTLYLCSVPVNLVTDLAILVLPIPVLTGIQLPLKQKTILVFTFALGIFVTIVDVVRIYYLQQAVDNQVYLNVNANARLGTEFDFAYNEAFALMWSAVEVNVGIICACIPTLKPLIKRILPSMIIDRSRIRTRGIDKKYASFDSQVAPVGRPSSIADPVPGMQPLPPARIGGTQEQEVSMMDFLTVPATDPTLGRTDTHRTNATVNSVYFGFLDMKRPKSMLKMKDKEAFKYNAVVTILFFMWGFSYGLLNVLNNEISHINNQKFSQNIGLTSAYFGAYAFGPPTLGLWVLRHGGFKATFITGLCIYAVGTLMFWPSAVLLSYPGFIISSFVNAFGLSVLETAANPFIALCGPPQYAEYRLLLAQGVQATGSILSQLLAERVFFKGIVDRFSLVDVQWTYLAITLFSVILALFFYYMPLPEATDVDLQIRADDLGIYRSTTIFTRRLPLIYVTLGLAVMAQFFYVGAQESMSIYLSPVLKEVTAKPDVAPLTVSISSYGVLAHFTFAMGRFVFAPLCLFIRPRYLLLFTIISGIIFSTLIMALDTSDNGVAGMIVMFFFFEGPCWPMIYAMGLRGLGRRTKLAAALITAGACGGGIFQFVMLAIQRLSHKTTRYSFCVIISLFCVAAIFPVYLNLVPGARHQVDPAKPVDLNASGDMEERDNVARRFSKRLSVVLEKFKGRSNRDSAEQPVVEHHESRRHRSWASARSGEEDADKDQVIET